MIQFFKTQTITMLEADFDELAKTSHVIANGWSSGDMSAVTVLGNKFGTPIAMRYMSKETGYDFKFVKLLVLQESI